MATINLPQGTPIPFTVSMPTGTGLTAANFDECDDVFAYLYTEETKKVKFSMKAKAPDTGIITLVRIDAVTLYGVVTVEKSKTLAPDKMLMIEAVATDTNSSVFPKEATIIPPTETGIKIVKSTIKEML